MDIYTGKYETYAERCVLNINTKLIDVSYEKPSSIQLLNLILTKNKYNAWFKIRYKHLFDNKKITSSKGLRASLATEQNFILPVKMMIYWSELKTREWWQKFSNKFLRCFLLHQFKEQMGGHLYTIVFFFIHNPWEQGAWEQGAHTQIQCAFKRLWR